MKMDTTILSGIYLQPANNSYAVIPDEPFVLKDITALESRSDADPEMGIFKIREPIAIALMTPATISHIYKRLPNNLLESFKEYIENVSDDLNTDHTVSASKDCDELTKIIAEFLVGQEIDGLMVPSDDDQIRYLLVCNPDESLELSSWG